MENSNFQNEQISCGIPRLLHVRGKAKHSSLVACQKKHFKATLSKLAKAFIKMYASTDHSSFQNEHIITSVPRKWASETEDGNQKD